ncbi:Hypothetical predicted protein [Mytilus galloprovincialis]|uniref:Uncharacterized protein n=1 Tax=Mytilus galloprovincialis TaxID=29158 RepID=A0A8B6DP37_MYTGA|nr:Hypothetical predicted protein [Mytilus galloprovincialis]
MFLECMGGLFPGCDEYIFAQTMVNSIIKNRIPQTFNPMSCFGVSGPSKFVAEVKINATWDEDLRSAETSKYRQLKSTIEQQAWMMFSNKVLVLKDNIETIDVLSFKPGSIIVEFAVIIKMNSDFYKTLQLEDFRQELLRAINELKMNPPTAPNYFTSVDDDSINITGSDDGNQEVSTPSTTTLAPDCNSMTYISSIIDSQCESSKSRLRMVNKDRKCSVLLDMIGCALFHTHICNKEQIVSTMSMDSWSMIGQNVSVFDPISCFGQGNEVVLPTIVPLNVTMMPCVNPDVVHYILNYDCYYYGLQKQMQGDDKLDSCRMYWYSSACLYGTLQTNKDKLGQCSLEEVNGVLTKYEDELFKVSPDNVTMSECLGLYKSADKCTRAMYSDDVFTIVQTCYGTAVANRMTAAYGIMDLSDYPCLIYQEMSECLYRPIKEHQLCLANQTEVMEDHMIWLTNGLNDIMTIAMGSPLDERKTVEKCIANVTKTPDFGQDLCDDGAGLIMSEITCLYYIGNPVCNSLESVYIPCLSNGLSRKRIFCSAERIWRSLSVVGDLFGKLTYGRVEISSCNRDTGSKQGTCPAVGNHTVGICVEECSGDYNCTGNQKCCSNGCGHVCMDPDSKNDSGRFNITIRFDLDWRPEYREENSTFRTTLTNELNKIIASSELKAYLKYIRVMVLRPGSIIAGCEAEFDKDIAEHKLEMTLKTRIEEIQDDPEYTILQKWSNLSVETLPDNGDTGNKQGTCPAVGNHTVGICVEECSGDYYCTGDQKCCSNGCGHVCMDPQSNNIHSYQFEITIKFDIPWESEYTDKTSVNYQNLTREILKQMAIISGDFRSSNISSMKITVLRQGSVYVVFEVIYYYQKTTSDVRSGMLGFVTAARMDPKSELDLIKAVDTDHIYVRIITGNRDTSGKQGTCPAVGNHTVGICVEECSGDYNCTGDQKCCSNGCGHVCMDPDSNKDESGRFNITIRFDLDWRPEYREENSTFRTTLSSELNRIIASSELKAYLKYIRVVVLRPGSIIAGCEAEFDMDITEHKLEMTLKTRIEEIQDDPEYIILQKWSNLSVEILPESEDVCTDVTKIARELQVCSSYLNYTQFKDNRTNCGLYNYFLNCVVSSVTANRQKCTRDSLEGIMQTVFESIGRSDLKALLSCSGQGSVYFRADLEYMKRVIRSHFSDTRHHAPQYSAYKQTAKQFIFDEFQRFGLDTEYHTFNDTEVSSTATFQSVIGVLKGTRFGTADDLISGLGAHYDTVNTSKGVDDNGSGVAAMLEVVRQITNINNSGYKSKNTIIFVSFDLEEYGGLSGSRNFLQDWLTPWLIKNYGSTIPEKLQGVIILDTIMEYNTSSQSQVFPLGALDQFQQFFPSAVESILSDDARGDFISLIYRQPTDDRVLAETFDSSWAAAGRSEFEIESFPLPFADLSSVPQENLALMYQFLRSDHANFWGANLPAIFLTDSANFRGDMIQCYHNPCDDLDTMLTDDNVNFLGKIADTVTATIHRLSEPFIPEDVDGICEDSMLMELIVNQSCTSYLQGFQNQSSCQALSSMVDRCLSPLMPGVTCDRNRMLSHVVTMVMVAKMLPVGFNISTCGSANHSNNAKQSISDMCLGQWGSCASQQDCHMVTWSYNLNTQMISFNVTAAIDSDKWMGVGFNGQKEMAGSDALVGWITPQATVTVTDRNNPSYYGSFLDTTQNVKNADWDRMNGITSISFQRHRDTKDTSDFIFSEDNCAYFIYPMGGSYNENDKSINMHSKTPTISLEQFCFPCAECKHLTLPDIRNKRLKDLLYYSVSPTCLRLDACFSPSIKIGRKTIKKSFKAFVDVDNCNFIVTLGFEGWRKSLILISYDWGDGSLKGLVESLGNKMTSEGFKLVLKQFGLDKIFPSSPCTVPDFTTDCPLVMDPKKYLPSNLHGMVRCNMTNDCFGLHCCLDLKFTVPFGVDIIELSVPMLFKMDSCNFEIEARFGNFKHKSSILNYDWAHFNVTL